MEKKTTWRVEGMHCPRCDSAVERAVRPLSGLKDAKADYRKGTLTARWDEDKTKEEEIASALNEAGYQLVRQSEKRRTGLRLCIALLCAIGLFLLLELTPLRALLAAFPTAREGMGFGALFLLGLMTSLHCVGMCGGINLAQSAGAAQNTPRVSAANLRYNLGRVLSYTLTGAIVGAVGSAFRLSSAAQAGLQLFAAAFMLMMALRLLDAGGAAFTLPKGLRLRGRSSLAVGLLNGLMPCGPLQSMQLYALASGSWWKGAVSMLCFGLGTVPLMLSFGLMGGRLNARFGRPVRLLSGGIVLAMAVAMLTNGLALAGFQLRLGANDATRAVARAEAQTVASELDWRGYPDITVTAGVPVIWTIHAEPEKITGCNNEMVIPALGLRIPLEAGDNVVEFTCDDIGVIDYTCWMGMLHGTITVVDGE